MELPTGRTGESDTLAGWARRAGTSFDFDCTAEPLLTSARVEWREDADAALTLDPLHSLGTGEARLMRERVEWSGTAAVRSAMLASIRTVTTERNDTLQLGIGGGVVQLVFARGSPLRWQRALLQILHGRPAGGTRC